MLLHAARVASSARVAVGLLLLLAAGCRHVAPPAAPLTEEERQQFPPATNMPGEPAASGLRYWRGPFTPLPVEGCYVSVDIKDTKGPRQYAVWQNTWGEQPNERNIVVQRGPSLTTLGPPEVVCPPTLITDVADPKHPGQVAPTPGYTRPALTTDPTLGYVLMTCVCPDYLPGSVPLLPALLVSPSGDPGTFKYLGLTTGDIAEEAAKRKIWSDGGTLVHLASGRWRMYANGFGTVVAALESDTLTGPWRFLRDDQHGIRGLLPDFPKAPNRGGCFPTVLRVDEHNWHLWITDTWPPQAIWHYWSPDGLAWRSYGQQPEITRAAVGGHGIKCLRAFVDPATGDLIGLLSVWGRHADGQPGWVLHQARMRPGPPPR